VLRRMIGWQGRRHRRQDRSSWSVVEVAAGTCPTGSVV